MESLTRIAYVDDDPDIREIVCFALRDIGGFEVRTWGDGASFLDGLNDWLPQLVLLDLMMPGMDGWETAAALHAHPRGGGVPVVLLSGAAEEVAADADGIVGILAKPFDPLSLAARLHAIWAGRTQVGG